MYVLTISLQKGGVAKTTTAINLAACLAEIGRRTLLIDTDPQGACSISLGIDPDALDASIHSALINDVPLAEVILSTAFGFDLAPANIDLAEAELQLSAIPLRELVLDRALRALQGSYDVVIIDTPPTLGLLTVNAFAAANSVLIPVSTQLLSLRGLTTLLNTVEKLKRFRVNEGLEILGILPTRYDYRTVHAQQVFQYLQAFGRERDIPVFRPIAATVRFDEAPNEHKPFVLMYPEHQAAEAYRQLAEEIDIVVQTQARH